MCIRDRYDAVYTAMVLGDDEAGRPLVIVFSDGADTASFLSCLLYTSDAADERSSVDLGGRRIIKKKTPAVTTRRRSLSAHRIRTH